MTSSHSTRLLMESPDDELDGSVNASGQCYNRCAPRCDIVPRLANRRGLPVLGTQNSMHLRCPTFLSMLTPAPSSQLPTQARERTLSAAAVLSPFTNPTLDLSFDSDDDFERHEMTGEVQMARPSVRSSSTHRSKQLLGHRD